MTNPTQTAPPSAPAAPTPPKAAVAISRELADFLLELSITLNKHAIYPSKHPLLDLAIYGVSNRLALLFDEHRESLSIGVARRQLIIEGVATDPYNPVLKELAQRLHKHHVGALKFVRGISREELAEALAALAVDPIRSEKPIGHDLERVGRLWEHVRFFPLTYDRLQLIEDDGKADPAGADQMGAGRATQLWIGLARAALVSDTSGTSTLQHSEADDNTALEPATVARAIDEHQREEAYDQVIVGYLLQIGEELRTADGPEAAGLQRRVSRLVGSLKESTLGKLLEMGGDKAQRRKFLLDASQGITVEAVIDLVKAASAAEGQTVSHSMLRMLAKLAHHPSSGGPKQKTDPTIRDVMRRLVDDWSLDDPNPEAYRKVLENMSSSRSNGGSAPNAVPTECEPERMVQIAIEVGAMGPQVRSAMSELCKSGRASLLLDLVERAPDADAGAPVWEFLLGERILDTLLGQQRVDFPLVGRFARRIGIPAVSPILAEAKGYEDAKIRTQFYDLLESLGDPIGPAVSEGISQAPPVVQRELIALLGRLGTLPANFSASEHLGNPEPLVRREAVKLLLRDPSARNEAIMAALTDHDDRVVFVGLTAAQEKCPPGASELIRQRVDRGELDSQLRTVGIRVVAQEKSPDMVAWLLGFVVSETRWSRRAKLRPSTPEMLAALSVIATTWADDPAAAQALQLAEQSKDPEVRAKVARKRSSESKGMGPA
ncbi:MAG TPA: hypothetical protein VIM21_10905 [Gemmatimonadaceae bacterium]